MQQNGTIAPHDGAAPVALSRRALLFDAAALCALALSDRVMAAPTLATPSIAALAEDAAIWGLPLVLTSRFHDKARRIGQVANQLYCNPALADATGTVPGYNVDTIYGYAWLDLAREPVVIDVPDTRGRYYSFQLMDAYANVFDYIGSRTTGTGKGRFVIAGPGWRGTLPAGAQLITARTSLVLVLVRTLVRGDDLAQAQAVQAAYRLAPLSAVATGSRPGIVINDAFGLFAPLPPETDGARYFDELDMLVRRYPPRGPETAVFGRLRALGLGRNFASRRPSAATLDAALARAIKRVQSFNFADAGRTAANGWHVNYGIEPFIADPLARASVNQLAPGAHIANECLYFMLNADSAGQPLDGRNRYTITFAPGQLPPVDGFWSITLYGADFMLSANPIGRHAIGDRTADLRTGADGSLTITLQHEHPADDHNWLPAPAGNFMLLMRTYLPRAPLLSRRYLPPPAIRL